MADLRAATLAMVGWTNPRRRGHGNWLPVMIAGVLVVAFAGSAPYAADPKVLGHEVVKIVADHFLDPARADAWVKAHGSYADLIGSPSAFTFETNRALADLKTSLRASLRYFQTVRQKVKSIIEGRPKRKITK